MDQPDSVNKHIPVDALAGKDTSGEVLDADNEVSREWFPEDEDDWYEPDYRKPDRRSS